MIHLSSTTFHRTAIVVGVANRRSLGWKTALSLLDGGFDHIFLTYQNDRFKSTVEAMVDEQNQRFSTNNQSLGPRPDIPSLSCYPCDVNIEGEIQKVFEEFIPSYFDSILTNSLSPYLDALVHCVAYAPSDAMKSADEFFPLLHTSKESFCEAHLISSYSLIPLSKFALPLLSWESSRNQLIKTHRSPSITTLTFLGSTRTVKNYNVMGPAKASLEAVVRGLASELSPMPHCVRVNAVSAGPVNTLAARGIRDFGEMKHRAKENSLTKRLISNEEVGNMVEFITSNKASAVTGQVIFCDGGYSAWGG